MSQEMVKQLSVTFYIIINKMKQKQINPQSFKKLWKTKKVTENIEPILLSIVKEYRVKVHKPQWSVTRRDLADRVFSEYIRLINADENWICECVTCWTKMPYTEIQNWHFISRWSMKYRFDKCNCHPQCYKCNCILSWNYKQYTMFMVKEYWMDKIQEMLNDKTTKEYKQYEYEEMIIQRYKEIADIKRKIKR